jgi:hypothetical protein
MQDSKHDSEDRVWHWWKSHLVFRCKILLTGIPSERELRFKNVTADPRGQVFCGM